MEYIAGNCICQETYTELRSRPDDRCTRLQIALCIFSVSTINVDARRIRRLDESFEIYQSKSTSPRSACLVRKSFTESVRPFCRDPCPPSVHISQNPNLSRNPLISILLHMIPIGDSHQVLLNWYRQPYYEMWRNQVMEAWQALYISNSVSIDFQQV